MAFPKTTQDLDTLLTDMKNKQVPQQKMRMVFDEFKRREQEITL
jgi:hypothetical protein